MKIWIFIDGTQKGPYTLEELSRMPVTPETKVWYAGLPKWYPAGTLDELKPLFDGTVEEVTVEVVEDENPPEPPAWSVPAAPVASEEEPAAPYYPATEGCDGCAGQPDGQVQFQPEMPLPAPAPEKCPPQYLVWNILLTVLCCSPFAVFGIFAAIKTGTAYVRGNLASSKRWSEASAWMVMISIALGALPSLFLAALL